MEEIKINKIFLNYNTGWFIKKARIEKNAYLCEGEEIIITEVRQLFQSNSELIIKKYNHLNFILKPNIDKFKEIFNLIIEDIKNNNTRYYIYFYKKLEY
jgi:hypothetical protein